MNKRTMTNGVFHRREEGRKNDDGNKRKEGEEMYGCFVVQMCTNKTHPPGGVWRDNGNWMLIILWYAATAAAATTTQELPKVSLRFLRHFYFHVAKK